MRNIPYVLAYLDHSVEERNKYDSDNKQNEIFLPQALSLRYVGIYSLLEQRVPRKPDEDASCVEYQVQKDVYKTRLVFSVFLQVKVWHKIISAIKVLQEIFVAVQTLS